MNPLSQREQLRRMYSNGASSPVLTVDPYEQEFRYAPNTFCPQHSRQNSFRKSAPKYGQSSFGQQKMRSERELYEQKQARYSPGLPFDFSNSEFVARFVRENQYRAAMLEMLTPPASASCSRSTLHGATSAPPFFTPRCTSPVPSEDVFTSFRPISEPALGEPGPNSFKGAITMPNGDVVYGGANVYTADRVHDLVKNQRDRTVPRIVSNKVFVGGISHSMNRETINSFFAQFGSVFVDWPVKGPRTNIRGKPIPMSSYSYLFLVYYEEKSVLKLMEACQSPVENEFYVCVPGYIESRIQIRPWFIRNAFYVSKKAMHARVIDIHRTVFVGGLPRIVTASEISQMFSEFGKVLLVTIDIDQDYGYPKGAARVTFERDWSFNKALEKRYLKFDNIDSSKTTIEIKPYVMEDVGCDQCGGLWFNPFLDVYDQLKSCLKTQEKPKSPSFSLENMWTPTSDELGVFDMWKSFHPKDSEHCDAERDEPEERQFLGGYETDKNEIRAGACKFVEMAKKFGLDNEQKVNVGGTDYPIGPDLWYHFVPPPYYEASYEPIKLRVDQQIESHLHLKRVNVCSNKSSYCKEAPCRQYYCPSCSNKLHSGPNQHILMPAGKPERRPRKDKNMYLVTQKS